MSQGGNVTLVGFVATEPKVRYVNSGTPVANMRIGSTSRKMDRETGEWQDGETNFYTVRCWRSLASNAATCPGSSGAGRDASRQVATAGTAQASGPGMSPATCR